jgi:hypothetical protein
MTPVLVPLEHAVVLLARLALHLRPQQKRCLLTDRRWLHTLDLPHPAVSSHGVILKSHRDVSPGLMEWAAVGLHDWSQLLSKRERSAFLLLRRCFPAFSTLRWIRRLSPELAEIPGDWTEVFEEMAIASRATSCSLN